MCVDSVGCGRFLSDYSAVGVKLFLADHPVLGSRKTGNRITFSDGVFVRFLVV